MTCYEWMAAEHTCAKCGWKGVGSGAQLGEMFRDGAEYDCPGCGQKLGYVMFPTHDEMQSDPRANPVDKALSQHRRRKLQAYDKARLVSPEQLPELDHSPLLLTWDVVEHPGLIADEVVIRDGERVIWRETSWYENYVRFGEVVAILRAKYGTALRDLVPTPGSELDLYGDALASPRYVDRVRAALAEPGIDAP